jgi:hypothetical protein
LWADWKNDSVDQLTEAIKSPNRNHKCNRCKAADASTIHLVHIDIFEVQVEEDARPDCKRYADGGSPDADCA